MRLHDFYYDHLKWCGCGDAVGAMTFMRDVLRTFVGDESSHKERWDKRDALLPGNLGLSYLYVLEAAELTEHGGSVYGSWLTPFGEQILSLLEGDIEAQME